MKSGPPTPQVVGQCGAANCGGPMLSTAGSVPRCARCQAGPSVEANPQTMSERLAAAESRPEGKTRGPREVGGCLCGSVLVVQPVLGAVVTCAAGCEPQRSAGALGDRGRRAPRARDKRHGW